MDHACDLPLLDVGFRLPAKPPVFLHSNEKRRESEKNVPNSPRILLIVDEVDLDIRSDCPRNHFRSVRSIMILNCDQHLHDVSYANPLSC